MASENVIPGYENLLSAACETKLEINPEPKLYLPHGVSRQGHTILGRIYISLVDEPASLVGKVKEFGEAMRGNPLLELELLAHA
jgi:hypothetical protein